MKDSLIQVTELTKLYETGELTVRALDSVSLTLEEAQLTVLLGPSGSGKSTLLNIVGGLDTATSGTVRFRNMDVTAMNERQLTQYRRKHVGFVFQFYNLIPSLTARENVRLVTEIAENPIPVDEALEMVGLENRRDHFPAQLSGGEQQRVAIARALAKRPDCLFCDEPTGALDSKTGVVVLNALARINEDVGTTVVIITHNAGISAMANQVVYFADGKVSKRVVNATLVDPSEIEW